MAATVVFLIATECITVKCIDQDWQKFSQGLGTLRKELFVKVSVKYFKTESGVQSQTVPRDRGM